MRKLIAGVVLIGALGLAGCGASVAPSSGTTSPVEDKTGYEIRDNDMSTFTVTLPSGRKVECVAVTYGKGSSLYCQPVSE